MFYVSWKSFCMIQEGVIFGPVGPLWPIPFSHICYHPKETDYNSNFNTMKHKSFRMWCADSYFHLVIQFQKFNMTEEFPRLWYKSPSQHGMGLPFKKFKYCLNKPQRWAYIITCDQKKNICVSVDSLYFEDRVCILKQETKILMGFPFLYTFSLWIFSLGAIDITGFCIRSYDFGWHRVLHSVCHQSKEMYL